MGRNRGVGYRLNAGELWVIEWSNKVEMDCETYTLAPSVVADKRGGAVLR